MKTKHPNILATLIAGAALALSASAAFAATSTTIDLSGLVVKSGKSISRASTTTLDAAAAYDLHFSGTVHGEGSASFLIEPNTTITSALAKLGFLSDSEGSSTAITVFNPGGALPFGIFNRSTSVSQTQSGITLKASAKATIGVASSGTAKIKLINPKLKLITPFGPQDAGSIVFDAGASLTVSVTPPASEGPQPDNVIILPDQSTIGNDVYSNGNNQRTSLTQKRGQAKSYQVAIQNDSTAADNYTVKAAITGDPNAFTVTFKNGKKNLTSAITGAGYTLDAFAGGAVSALSVKVVPKAKAAHSATATIAITTSNGSQSDTVLIQPTVK